jgi:hypothetical protein
LYPQVRNSLTQMIIERVSTRSLKIYWISDDCEEHARKWLDEEYEIDHRKLDEEYVQKDWEYQTNINDQTSAASVSCSM